MTTDTAELAENLIPKDKLAQVAQSATEIVANLHLSSELAELNNWKFQPSHEMNSGSWSQTVAGPHGELNLVITTFGKSRENEEITTAHWSPPENSESTPGIKSFMLTITKKPNEEEKREISVEVDRLGSEGTLTLSSDKVIPEFTPLDKQSNKESKSFSSFLFFKKNRGDSKTMNVQSTGGILWEVATKHPKDPLGLGLEIFTALSAGQTLDDLKPKPERFDHAVKQSTEILSRAVMARRLMDKFIAEFPKDEYTEEKTSAFASGQLVSRLSNQLGFSDETKNILVSDQINPAFYESREKKKKSLYSLGLIASEGNNLSPPESSFDILPDLDHDWDWQPDIPFFVSETISSGRSGFEKKITLPNTARLTIGVNAEVAGSHSKEGRSISNITCEAPINDKSSWDKVQIVEIEGFTGGSIKYITFTGKNGVEIVFKTIQKLGLSKTSEEPIQAKILSTRQKAATFGNPIDDPFVEPQKLVDKLSNDPAILELMKLNTEDLIEAARGTIRDFVSP